MRYRSPVTQAASTSLPFNRKPLMVLIVLAIIMNAAGIGIRFFTDDPALYATIARTMAKTGNFADLMYRGQDWLDKPHFPFWMADISFKIFGVNTVAYKLPALLFFFMSVLYTWLLTKKFYGRDTALIAILILLTAQHAVMSNTDVRAEPYIMGLLMGAVYHFSRLKDKVSFLQLVLGALFTACAVMTKGIYLLIPIGCAIIGDYLFKGEIKKLFHWRWLLAFVLTVVFTFPEIYTLYQQFDLHPEKVVFGRTHISGIKWFLWDSQFGRFNDTSYIHSHHGDPFFFIHTLLWAFAPWAIVLFYSIFKIIRNMVKRIPQREYLAISGGLVMLLIFSISKFQLPFYTNILFPFFAMITASLIASIVNKAEARFFRIAQYIIGGALLAALVLLDIFFAPGFTCLFTAGIVLFVLLVIWLFRNSAGRTQKAYVFSVTVSILVNAYLLIVLYPIVVSYKGDVMAAGYLKKNYPNDNIASTIYSNSLDFYAKGPITYKTADELKADTTRQIIFTDEAGLTQFQIKPGDKAIIWTFDDYPRETLVPAFLNKATRRSTLKHYYLIKLY